MNLKDEIEEANSKVFERLLNSKPVLVDFRLAEELIPSLNKDPFFLHAGPPVTWDRMSGPQRGAVIGALIYEGLTDSPSGAEKLVEGGDVGLSPCHEHGCVGPMAGVISASMPLAVVEDSETKKRAYTNLNEGLGDVLRFGAYGEKVQRRLEWMKETLAPALKTAVRDAGGIELNAISSKALHMNDECHNRNVAASCLLQKKLSRHMLSGGVDKKELTDILDFFQENEHFYLNFSMAACKLTMDSGANVEKSTIVTAMTRNGTDFGIRVSSLGGEWFVTEAPEVEGLYFPGYTRADAARDMGDSCITETRGLGGFSMAAAPSIVQFVGGASIDAVNYTKEMYEITVGRDPNFTIPQLDFQGIPLGIDLRKVIRKGVAPIINTGIAHREPGVGQIGAGTVRAPMECFVDALKRFSEKYGA